MNTLTPTPRTDASSAIINNIVIEKKYQHTISPP